MAEIDVQRKSDSRALLQFIVRVVEDGETVHHVSAPADYIGKLSRDGETPESLICRSCEFLLEREPKESILSRFELQVIGRYFPDYESTISKR